MSTPNIRNRPELHRLSLPYSDSLFCNLSATHTYITDIQIIVHIYEFDYSHISRTKAFPSPFFLLDEVKTQSSKHNFVNLLISTQNTSLKTNPTNHPKHNHLPSVSAYSWTQLPEYRTTKSAPKD